MDTISVAEQAYSLEGDGGRWLSGLCERTRSVLAPGAPIFGYTFELGTFNERLQRYNPVDFSSIVTLDIPHEQARQQLERAPEAMIYVLSRTDCSTLSAQLDEAPDDVFRVREYRNQIVEDPDLIGIVGVNPSGHGLCLVISLEEVTVLPGRTRSLWTHLAAHMATGLRLRRALALDADAALPDVGEAGEAVIDPGGRIAHAQGSARTATARERLRRGAIAVDRARRRRPDMDPDEAIDLWQGLVRGRWSLVEQFDSDGRRFYVAHENPPNATAPRALSTRERQVVAYAAQGLSDKLIGYHLGIARSTVASHLARARRKLGVGSRVDLVRLAASLSKT